MGEGRRAGIGAAKGVASGAKDFEVIARAREEGRVQLTEDKDFEQLVYAGGKGGAGAVLLRFPAPASTYGLDSPSCCK